MAESIQCPLLPSLVRWPNAGLRPPGIAANASSQRNPGLEGFGGDRERLMSALVWIDLSKRSRGAILSEKAWGLSRSAMPTHRMCPDQHLPERRIVLAHWVVRAGPRRVRRPRRAVGGAFQMFWRAPLKCVPLLLSRLLLSREPQSQSNPVDVSDRPAPHYPQDVLEAAIHKPGGKRGFRGSSRHGQREAICGAVASVSNDLTMSRMTKTTKSYSRD
jgi:hypothetical protein